MDPPQSPLWTSNPASHKVVNVPTPMQANGVIFTAERTPFHTVKGLPVVTRFFWPPLMPLISWLPIMVSAQICSPGRPIKRRENHPTPFHKGQCAGLVTLKQWSQARRREEVAEAHLEAEHAHDIVCHDAVALAPRDAGPHEGVDLPVWLDALLFLPHAHLMNFICTISACFEVCCQHYDMLAGSGGFFILSAISIFIESCLDLASPKRSVFLAALTCTCLSLASSGRQSLV